MDLIACPHCHTRVLLSSRRECPSCRKGVDDPPAVAVHVAHEPPPTAARHDPAVGDDSTLATIATFEFEQEAEDVRGRLEGEGIPAFLDDAHIVGMTWVLGNAVGYIKLRVPSDRAAQAAGLLRDWRGAWSAEEPSPGEEATGEEDGDDAETAGTTGVLDALRGLKGPLFWLVLTPLIAALGFGVLAAVVDLVWTVLGA